MKPSNRPAGRVAIPPPPLHGINNWLPSAARVCRNAGLTEIEALARLKAYEPGLRRAYQPQEAERAVDLVYGHRSRPKIPGRQAPRPRPLRQQKAKFNPDKLARFAANLPEAQSVEWLKARSPLPVGTVGTDECLRLLSNEGEILICYQNMKSQGQLLWRNEGAQDNDPFASWRHGLTDGAWFLPQPVTGQWISLERLKRTDRPKGMTRRAEENVTAFRFAVVESDMAPLDQWLSALAQLPLKIVSVTTSGGKSIHALVRLDAANKREWDELVRGSLYGPLVELGADPGALTAVRLTRLPGIHRGSRLQELLFLNPAADGQPIANLLPPPSPHGR